MNTRVRYAMTNHSRAYLALLVLKDFYQARDLLARIAGELSDLGQETMSDAVDSLAMDLADERVILEVIQANWEENDK